MSDAGTEGQLKKAGHLRSTVDRLDRDEQRARLNRTWLGRRLRIANAVLTLAVAGVLTVDAWLAFEAFTGDSGSTEVQQNQQVPYYEDLEIFDEGGSFGGRLTIVNPMDRDVEVFVDVDIYDGDQNVGGLFGSMSLKPDSESVLELSGMDDYVEHTDSRVHLTGWPE